MHQWLLLVGTIALIAGGMFFALRSVVTSIQRESDIRYRRTEAWLAIYSVIQPRVPFPTIQPYMATPELLRHVIHQVLERKPGLIVELGSGISTLIAAYGAEQLGKCQIISVDHEARFRDATQATLAAHGLSHRVKLIHAPLVPVQSGSLRSQWYDPNIIRAAIQESGAEIGMLLVDGPPGMDQKLARLPAVPQLHDRLAADCVVLVDDARRADEQEMVRQWMQQFPGWDREFVETEKGLILLRRSR
ncbi:MAG TPA: class I SAM-dependent methyltransferase [Gemmatimonadales bacterium]|nr:class I SAM-dependent methyltransferase [Gemmatimonadales bacterium]